MRESVDYIPIATTFISLAFAYVVFQRYRRKVREGDPRRTHLLWWTIGIATFGAGTFTEGFTTLLGWNTPIFKSWYVVGALLGGWPLAQGSVYLHFNRKLANRLTVVTVAYVVIASIAVLVSPINYALVEEYELSGRVLEWRWVRLLSPLINTYAVIFLIGGAIYSAWIFYARKRDDVRGLGNVLIATGAILPGIGGSFSRAGHTEVLYVGEFIGLLLIYAGYRMNVAASTRDARISEAVPAAQFAKPDGG